MALPFLESMAGNGAGAARLARPPKRAAFFYVPNGVVQSTWHPEETGEGFALSPTLEPLACVREKISVFTKLDRVKVAGTDGHAQAGACWLSSAAPDELSPAGYPLERTLDQIIAAHTGKETPFRSLELSCNPFQDNKESVYFDNISWYGHGHVAPSMKDPQQVFDRLFNIDASRNHGSALDLVMEDAKYLGRSLGRADRGKLDEYMDSVRTVERQIERAKARQASIEELDIEGPDTPWTAMARHEYIQVMGDLMILAFQTDMTRVATLMSTPERWSTPLMVHGLFDKPVLHHNWTHEQGNENVRRKLAQLDRYHVEQFAAVVAKMDGVKEIDGSTLLDNSLFTFGSGLSSGKNHVYTDLPTIVAGSGGGVFRTNRHERYEKGTPVANLWLSIAQAMDVTLDRFADSTGPLERLG